MTIYKNTGNDTVAYSEYDGAPLGENEFVLSGEKGVVIELNAYVQALSNAQTDKRIASDQREAAQLALSNERDLLTERFREAVESGNGLDTDDIASLANELGLDLEEETEVTFELSVTVTVTVAHIGELDEDDIELDVDGYDGSISVTHPTFDEVSVTDVSFSTDRVYS